MRVGSLETVMVHWGALQLQSVAPAGPGRRVAGAQVGLHCVCVLLWAEVRMERTLRAQDLCPIGCGKGNGTLILRENNTPF